MSWVKPSPRGVFSKGQFWRSLVCDEHTMSSSSILACLSNHTVFIIGDSNGRCLFESVKSFIPVPETGLAHNKRWNISLRYKFHDHPTLRRPAWASVNLFSPSEALDKIPSTGNYVVIIHYYLHFSAYHLSELYLRLIALKHSLSALVKRNPRVHIGIRGPHISTKDQPRNHMFGGDVLAPFMIKLHHEIFLDMTKYIVYLDGWDMSIASRNERFHPPSTFTDAMFKTLLSYKCH